MTSSVWDRLEQEAAQAGKPSRKMAWRLLRQFQSSEAIAAEFGTAPDFLWQLQQQSQDVGSIKLLLTNAAGQRCEAVALFPSGTRRDAPRSPQANRLPRATACISSQPGCGVGCPFCATGELGYRGNLSSHEIVEQVYWIGVLARQSQRRLRNVVFMGMGEPLHNLTEVLAALRLLTSDHGFGFPQRRIMLSTAGVPQGMVRLAREFPELRIALSLHAAEPELRRKLVPRAVGDPSLLRQAVRQVNELQPRHPVWLEVVLFEGLNDSAEHARALVDFCRELHVEVNLIPYNTAANATIFRAAPWDSREAFAGALRAAGIRTTIRSSLGQNSQAACGQLNAFYSDDRVAKQGASPQVG